MELSLGGERKKRHVLFLQVWPKHLLILQLKLLVVSSFAFQKMPSMYLQKIQLLCS